MSKSARVFDRKRWTSSILPGYGRIRFTETSNPFRLMKTSSAIFGGDSNSPSSLQKPFSAADDGGGLAVAFRARELAPKQGRRVSRCFSENYASLFALALEPAPGLGKRRPG